MAERFVDGINQQRERDQRVNLINAVENSAGRQALMAQSSSNAAARDSTGYWDGGNGVNFFTLGESGLGGPDVME